MKGCGESKGELIFMDLGVFGNASLGHTLNDS